MPHSAEDKHRAITRLRRIRGQADALERAVEAGSDCAPILQQLAAMRGAVHGLMADLLDSHMRETMAKQPAPTQADIDEMLALLGETPAIPTDAGRIVPVVTAASSPQSIE